MKIVIRPAPKPEIVLAPHATRSIRVFLKQPTDDKQMDDAQTAFWDLVFSRHPQVSYNVAIAVETQLEKSPRKIQELIDGWRPRSLR